MSKILNRSRKRVRPAQTLHLVPNRFSHLILPNFQYFVCLKTLRFIFILFKISILMHSTISLSPLKLWGFVYSSFFFFFPSWAQDAWHLASLHKTHLPPKTVSPLGFSDIKEGTVCGILSVLPKVTCLICNKVGTGN